MENGDAAGDDEVFGREVGGNRVVGNGSGVGRREQLKKRQGVY